MKMLSHNHVRSDEQCVQTVPHTYIGFYLKVDGKFHSNIDCELQKVHCELNTNLMGAVHKKKLLLVTSKTGL